MTDVSGRRQWFALFRDEDRDAVEVIREAHGHSIAGAIRYAVRKHAARISAGRASTSLSESMLAETKHQNVTRQKCELGDADFNSLEMIRRHYRLSGMAEAIRLAVRYQAYCERNGET